jgi:hypothetical protein
MLLRHSAMTTSRGRSLTTEMLRERSTISIKIYNFNKLRQAVLDAVYILPTRC